jgi:hypothetical protein
MLNLLKTRKKVSAKQFVFSRGYSNLHLYLPIPVLKVNAKCTKQDSIKAGENYSHRTKMGGEILCIYKKSCAQFSILKIMITTVINVKNNSYSNEKQKYEMDLFIITHNNIYFL